MTCIGYGRSFKNLLLIGCHTSQYQIILKSLIYLSSSLTMEDYSNIFNYLFSNSYLWQKKEIAVYRCSKVKNSFNLRKSGPKNKN